MKVKSGVLTSYYELYDRTFETHARNHTPMIMVVKHRLFKRRFVIYVCSLIVRLPLYHASSGCHLRALDYKARSSSELAVDTAVINTLKSRARLFKINDVVS